MPRSAPSGRRCHADFDVPLLRTESPLQNEEDPVNSGDDGDFPGDALPVHRRDVDRRLSDVTGQDAVDQIPGPSRLRQVHLPRIRRFFYSSRHVDT